jgi:hypothetical protein
VRNKIPELVFQIGKLKKFSRLFYVTAGVGNIASRQSYNLSIGDMIIDQDGCGVAS